MRGLIDKAVKEHLLSDVPVASFLSGGIDSSIVTAIAAQRLERKLQTYSQSVSTLRSSTKASFALEIAQRYGTDHQRIQLSEEEVIHSVTEAVEHLDLPSVDAINTYIVSRAVAARGVKVALSGLGGDELFGGYPSFHDVPRLKFLARTAAGSSPGARRDRPARRSAGGSAETDDAGELARWRRRFFTDDDDRSSRSSKSHLPFECPVELPDDFARISWAELTGYMRRMLLRDADQMSMAVSLELRVPFLDHELVEYVLRTSRGGEETSRGPKGLLIEACRDLLPPSFIDRPKRGFVLPMRAWMLGPLAPFVEEGLDEVVGARVAARKILLQMH